MCKFCIVVWFYFVRHALTMTVVSLHRAFPHYVIFDIQLPRVTLYWENGQLGKVHHERLATQSSLYLYLQARLSCCESGRPSSMV